MIWIPALTLLILALLAQIKTRVPKVPRSVLANRILQDSEKGHELVQKVRNRKVGDPPPVLEFEGKRYRILSTHDDVSDYVSEESFEDPDA